MSPLGSHKGNTALAQAYYNAEAGRIFTQTEGLVPAPVSCHAVKAAIDKALECKAAGEEKTIVFCMSGHGLIDLYGYEQFIEGTLPSSSVD